jgi:hypothetical protein
MYEHQGKCLVHQDHSTFHSFRYQVLVLLSAQFMPQDLPRSLRDLHSFLNGLTKSSQTYRTTGIAI